MNDLEKLQDQSPHAAAIGFVLTGTDGPACLFKMPYAEHEVKLKNCHDYGMC